MYKAYTILLTAFTFAVLQVLCAPTPAAAYDKTEFLPPDGQAAVVFVQNLRADEKMTFIVFDTDKRTVAEVGGRQAAVVPMQPGQYTFYVTSFKTRRIDLELEAGRSYFVLLHTVERFGARVAEVTPVRRATESYLELKSWLQGVWIVHARDDKRHGKSLRERAGRTQHRMNQANGDWKAGDDAYRGRHTLHKHEGLTAQDVSWL